MNPEKWAYQTEVAEILGLDDSTVSRRRKKSNGEAIEVVGVKIPFIQFGARWIYDRDAAKRAAAVLNGTEEAG